MCGPHRQAACNHTEGAVMQHTIKQSTNIPLMSTYELWQSRWIMTNTTCSKMIKIIYKPENQHIKSNDIQQWVYACEVSRTIMTKSKLLYNSKIINQYNQHVNVSNEYSNEVQKHCYIRILNQDNQSTQSTCQCPKWVQ